jgi:hypothetical protein
VTKGVGRLVRLLIGEYLIVDLQGPNDTADSSISNQK